jgi:glycerol-3-phosphate acyltransferase PlsX
VRETSELLNASSLNFIGNLEPGDLTGGNAEVVVCDGFVGNMVLKLTEALGQAIVTDIEAAVGQTDSGAALARDVFDRTNVLEALGGGPLLGVNGVAIVGHGKALAPSIANAIATAVTIVTTDFVKASAEELSKIRTEVLN